MQESERIFIAENATLLRGSERELNRQLFTILNSIYDGLYITDGQANTILINRAYEEVSGLRREDVLGKSMQEIVATGMIDRSGSLGVLKTRKPVTLEQTFRTGKQALITSTPHFDSSGEIDLQVEVAAVLRIEQALHPGRPVAVEVADAVVDLYPCHTVTTRQS